MFVAPQPTHAFDFRSAPTTFIQWVVSLFVPAKHLTAERPAPQTASSTEPTLPRPAPVATVPLTIPATTINHHVTSRVVPRPAPADAVTHTELPTALNALRASLLNIATAGTLDRSQFVTREFLAKQNDSVVHSIAIANGGTRTALTDADIPDSITASNYLPLAGGALTGDLSVSGNFTVSGAAVYSGTASSTFANGINLTAGCFAVNGVCVGSSGAATWGSITGTLLSQTDLQTALNGKIDNSTSSLPNLATLTGLVSYGSSSATTTDAGSLKITSDLLVSGYSYLGTIKTGTWSGTSIGDAYIDDNITASNYVLTSAYNGLFDVRLGATTSLPQIGILTGLSTIGSSSATSTVAGNLQVSGSSTISGILKVNGTASSTFANGINLTAGCFAVNGVCVGSSGAATWGSITGTLSSQTDLQTALNGKINTSTTTLPFIGTLAGLVSFGSSSATTTTLGSLGVGTVAPSALLQVTNTGLLPTFLAEDATSVDTSPFIIDANGNVGIGTTSPQRKLHVTNDGSLSQILLESTGSAADQHYWGFNASSTGSFAINSMTDALAASNKLTITSGGNVGIGTSTPFTNLSVNGTIYGTGWNFFGTSPTGVTGAGNIVLASSPIITTPFIATVRGGSTNTSNITIQGTSNSVPTTGGNIIFQPYVNFEAARFTTTGNLGIGTSSPVARFTVVATSGSSTIPLLDLQAPDLVTGLSTSSKFTVLPSGRVGIGMTSPATALDVNGTITQTAQKGCSTGLTTDALGSISGCVASDERLKKNVEPLMLSLDTLGKLSPVTYEWRDTNRDTLVHAGFIAQEVEKVFPQAVVSAGNGFKGVDPNAILALVVTSLESIVDKVNGFADNFISKHITAEKASIETIESKHSESETANVTKELCVDGTCITGDQLRALLQQSGQHEVPVSAPQQNTDTIDASSSDESSSTPQAATTTIETTDQQQIDGSIQTPAS